MKPVIVVFSAAILVLSVLTRASISDVEDLGVIRRHANDYLVMSPTQAMAASISQVFSDLGNRSVLTAFSLDAQVGERWVVHGIKVDFMVGRRIAGSHASMNFLWDAIGLLRDRLVVELRAFSDCGGRAPCGSCPCEAILSSVFMNPLRNNTAIYELQTYSWGRIYQADFLLNLRHIPLAFEAAHSDRSERIWVVVAGHLPQRDIETGYEYTFRLPVWEEDVSRPDLMVHDPDHLINTTWTTWMRGSAIAPMYYAGMVNPQVGFLAAGNRSEASAVAVPSPAPPHSNTSSDVPEPLPTPEAPLFSPVGVEAPQTSEQSTAQTVIIIVGIVAASIVLVLIAGFLIAIVVVKAVKRWRDRSQYRRGYEIALSPLSEFQLDDGDLEVTSEGENPLAVNIPSLEPLEKSVAAGALNDMNDWLDLASKKIKSVFGPDQDTRGTSQESVTTVKIPGPSRSNYFSDSEHADD